MSDPKSIVFVGVDVDLFKSCFCKKEDGNWESNYKFVVLDINAATASADLSKILQKPDVLSVVFEDFELDRSLLNILKHYYDTGGLVVFFGIYGEFAAPSGLSSLFGLSASEAWSFSAYTCHVYELTSTATNSFGFGVTELPYTKSNLLRVPVQDRWLVPKAMPLHEYIDNDAGFLDGEAPGEMWNNDAKTAKEGYAAYCESLYEQCPLAVHKNANGGRLAYLGFVNGDGNVPKIVRALVTKTEIQ